MRKIFLPALLLITFTSSAQRILPLEEAIAAALKNNYNILLAKNDSSAAALDLTYKNAAFLPRLNGNLGKVWNNNALKQVLSDGTKRESKAIKSNT